jgi:pectate lyase
MLKKIFIPLMLLSGSVFAFQGFGKNDGGNNYPIYHVTNLNDNGAGSLRDALSQSGRHVVFDVNGSINLLTPININLLSNISIDGTYNKAQHPNLELLGNGINLINSSNIILQNFRIHNAKKYGILISNNSYNIIVDHMSIINSSQADEGVLNFVSI